MGKTLRGRRQTFGQQRGRWRGTHKAHRGRGERGGGWLAYPWRNQASHTLKGKGCYAVKLQRDATEATDSGGELSGSELSGGELSDEGILKRKVGRRAVGADTVLYAGVGLL